MAPVLHGAIISRPTSAEGCPKMKVSLISAVLLASVLALTNLAQANTIHTQSTGSYGTDASESHWDVSPSSTLISSGVPIDGSQEAVCPNQDVNGGTCASGVYDFLYQISSAPSDLTLTFTGLPASDPDFDLGVLLCGPPTQNTIALCTNTTATTEQTLNITDSSALTSATFSILGALPTFSAGTGGEGDLTFYLVLDETGAPVSPTLTASITPAPEPSAFLLLLVGLTLLLAFSSFSRSSGRISSSL